jgi:hypothetical protein
MIYQIAYEIVEKEEEKGLLITQIHDINRLH